jgi:hypothetical protein
MLWTDGFFVTAADLAQVDADVNKLSAAMSITMDGTGGVCHRGIENAGRDILSKLSSFSGFVAGPGLSYNHLAAVFNTGSTTNNRTRAQLSNVVVSDPHNSSGWTDVKIFAIYHSLLHLFRMAMNRANSSDDRYQTKFDRYKKELETAVWPTLKVAGLPVVVRPLYRPGAAFTFSPGTFALSTQHSSGTAGGTLHAAVTYVSSSTLTNNESHPSESQSVVVASGDVLSINITGLNPPTGVQSRADAARAAEYPLAATHWNLYVGTSSSQMYLQNASPIAIATKTYSLTGDPTSTGALAGFGQYPEQYIVLREVTFRG